MLAPAKCLLGQAAAGTQSRLIPARCRRNDDAWIPACAGMTIKYFSVDFDNNRSNDGATEMENSKPAVPNAPGSPPPKLKAPANAADCHIHIYDARFKSSKPALPYADVANYRLLEQCLRALRART